MRYLILVCALLLAGCGGDSPNSVAPTPVPTPTPAPVPAPQAASLTGSVTVTNTTVRVNGFTIRILDGPNAGQTTTTANGTYTFTGIQAGNMNVSATADGWNEARGGASVNGPTTLNFTTQTTAPWRRVGTGNDVWTKPAWVTRATVHGFYGGSSQNFALWCGTQLVVNEILGTFRGLATTYDGTHNVPSCTEMHTEISNGVSWQVQEVR